ncbi:aromatic acid/H+ symport family MFS transporter [Crenobacter sp. SG2305]|uniref:MFS transporter n=1 Tax=Crenobacter oryzisoli TaxID=3056844 RepID=UPI0025AA5AC2|nr:aromatic acid/H+ symport family MFS transporter [Crenobacter sp. SG2305]MDN0083771.1 aromatic acid/H+ symport family MFS transporter [Crenobacter sp. SG2305]
MDHRPHIDVQQFIDTHPFSRFQKTILLLCFLVVLVDGFDTASIGFIAPAIRDEWHLSSAALAPLFGAGLFGLMSGALLFGPLADKVGRKPVLVLSVLFFGLASAASMFSPDLPTLIALRFLTGVGLGGAMPSAITLTSEYCPQPRRARLVTLMFCGFTVGSALGGLVSVQLLPHVGWRGVLLVGGAIPLLLALGLKVLLAESLRFLVLSDCKPAAVQAIVARIAGAGAGMPDFTVGEAKIKSPVRELFRGRLAAGTLLIWASFFMSLLIVYLLSSWLPILLNSTGISLSRASLVTAMFQVGGTIGAILLGRLMDRFGATRTLSLSYLAGAVFIGLCSVSTDQFAALMLAVFGIGFCISGGQVGANAMAAAFYPTGNRATGVSWSNAVGRCGSVLGSLSGGWLLAMHLPIAHILLLLAFPSLIAALAIAVLGRVKAHIAAQGAPEAVATLGTPAN